MVRPGGKGRGVTKMKNAKARKRVAPYNTKRKPIRTLTRQRKWRRKEEIGFRSYEPSIRGSRRARDESSDDDDGEATDGAESWDGVSEDSYDSESDDGRKSNGKGKGKGKRKMSDRKLSSRSGSEKRTSASNVKAASRSNGSETLDQTPHQEHQKGEAFLESQAAAQAAPAVQGAERREH